MASIKSTLKWFKFKLSDFEKQLFSTIAVKAKNESAARTRIRKEYGKKYNIGMLIGKYNNQPSSDDVLLAE